MLNHYPLLDKEIKEMKVKVIKKYIIINEKAESKP